MRRLSFLGLAVMLGASLAMAGAPGGDRGRGDRGRGGPDRGRMMEMMRGRTGGTDIFDVARRSATVPADKQADLAALASAYAVEQNEGTAKLRRELNKAYLVRVVALLPDEEKAKYEKVIAALTERDEAIEAAQKTLREALDKVKVSQGADKAVPAEEADPRRRFFQPRRGEAPTRKFDVLRSYFVLTDEQRKQVEDLHNAHRDDARNKMRARFAALRGGGGRPDPAAMRQMGQLFRQSSDEVDKEDAEAVVQFLTDAQKKDFATACAAMDACKKAIDEATATCRKKVNEAVGEEKANAILGPLPQAIVAPAGPAPEKKTEF